jgi:hypothetical protein
VARHAASPPPAPEVAPGRRSGRPTRALPPCAHSAHQGAHSAPPPRRPLQENILLGDKLDEERYEEALEVAQLNQDLAILPNGDGTEIGDRGITLSGGQKQRVSIARAVYAGGWPAAGRSAAGPARAPGCRAGSSAASLPSTVVLPCCCRGEASQLSSHPLSSLLPPSPLGRRGRLPAGRPAVCGGLARRSRAVRRVHQVGACSRSSAPLRARSLAMHLPPRGSPCRRGCAAGELPGGAPGAPGRRAAGHHLCRPWAAAPATWVHAPSQRPAATANPPPHVRPPHAGARSSPRPSSW